jgi:hypothetical protein
MSTWEERMASKAASRAVVRANPVAEPQPEPPPEQEEYIQRLAREMIDGTTDFLPGPFACACMGPPRPDFTMCFCHLQAEAECRLTGARYPWASCSNH